MAKGTSVLNPNLGLYFDRPKLAIPSRGLSDGINFRIKDGKLNNLNLGWVRFGSFVLNGPVRLIDHFFPTSQGLPERLIFGTETDLYQYDPSTENVTFLTPRYETGTASANGTVVTGVGTSWASAVLHIRAGDQIHFGAAGQTNPAAVWYTIAGTPPNNTTINLTTSAGVIGNGPYTIRRLFSGGVDTEWSTDAFIRTESGDDEWWATNGVDNIVRWNGSLSQVEDEAAGTVLGFLAKTLKVWSNMMIFGNITQAGDLKPQDIINSDVGDPDDIAVGLSEQFKIHSGGDEILTMEPLGDNLVIYSKEHVVLAQFVGDPLIFVFREVTDGVGPISSKVVANFGDYHEFIGRDTQYTFDGVTVRETSMHVWREVLRTQDPTRVQSAYHHFDEENGELMWVLPLTTDPGAGTEGSAPAVAYVEAYLEQVGERNPRPYSARQFPFTATGYYSKQEGITWDELTDTWADYNFRWNDQFFFSAFPINMAGAFDGKIYTFNSSQNADGAALPSYVVFSRRPTADGRERALVTRVYPWMTQFANSVFIVLQLMDHAAGNPTIADSQSFDQNLLEGRFFTSHFRRGRFFEVKVGSNGPNEPWELHGYDIDLKHGGRR